MFLDTDDTSNPLRAGVTVTSDICSDCDIPSAKVEEEGGPEDLAARSGLLQDTREVGSCHHLKS